MQHGRERARKSNEWLSDGKIVSRIPLLRLRAASEPRHCGQDACEGIRERGEDGEKGNERG